MKDNGRMCSYNEILLENSHVFLKSGSPRMCCSNSVKQMCKSMDFEFYNVWLHYNSLTAIGIMRNDNGDEIDEELWQSQGHSLFSYCSLSPTLCVRLYGRPIQSSFQFSRSDDKHVYWCVDALYHCTLYSFHIYISFIHLINKI